MPLSFAARTRRVVNESRKKKVMDAHQEQIDESRLKVLEPCLGSGPNNGAVFNRCETISEGGIMTIEEWAEYLKKHLGVRVRIIAADQLGIRLDSPQLVKLIDDCRDYDDWAHQLGELRKKLPNMPRVD
jgi:hypothetical protein